MYKRRFEFKDQSQNHKMLCKNIVMILAVGKYKALDLLHLLAGSHTQKVIPT